MKKYSTPELILTAAADIITASAGDTPTVDFEW